MTSSSKPIRRFRGWMNRNVPLMITCGELEAFLVDYLDGTLPRGTRQRFRLHLNLCADCRAYVRSYEAAVALGKAAFAHPDDAPPDTVPDELLRAVLDAQDRDTSDQEPRP